MQSNHKTIHTLKNKKYQYGFTTDIKDDQINPGLNECIIKDISFKKKEPKWLLSFRLKAFKYWQNLNKNNQIPQWSNITYPHINFNDIIYYSSPKQVNKNKTLNDIDPNILDTYNKLGIPLQEQKILSNIIAVDAIFDSVSVATTFKNTLNEHGIIFCSFSEAVQKHPNLIQQYLGSVVPYSDNYFAALNSAVFSDGSFCFIPKNTHCPMELSTYFRINAARIGQFERTLIIAENKSYVSYLEGCTAPIRDENQLHAAVVELIALDNATIKYSTVQNWYPGDINGKGGIFNFVTKRGLCKGNQSKISWIQIETGSAITWKYPSCILYGNHSKGEFYSVSFVNNMQQADTGSKMIHIGENTTSNIISKSISAGKAQNTYRGLIRIQKKANYSKNYSQCDSMLFGDASSSYTIPTFQMKNDNSHIEHEAVASKIKYNQMHYCYQRGFSKENAISLIVNGFCKSVFKKLPMEFAVEAQKLMNINMENAIG